jgi:ABC-type nitrate/sulfonate/bicarbonate transport system substrate-binding protein
VAAYGLTNCTLHNFADTPAQLNAAASGQADATVGALSVMGAAVKDNKIKAVADWQTADPVLRAKFGDVTMDSVYWGLTDNLKAKIDAVARWLKAVDRGWQWLETHSNEEAMKLVQGKYEGFRTVPLETLTAGLEATRPMIFTGSSKGYVTEKQWNDMLANIGTWDVPNFTHTDPAYGYAQRVDMSFYEKGVGKPAS